MAIDDARKKAARALALVDLTDLTDDCTPDAIETLCRDAQTAHGPVAAVCVWPRFVSQAKRCLGGSGIKIATVVNFPSGAEETAAVVAETRMVLDDGADEIDLVMPYRAFIAGDRLATEKLIARVKSTVSGHAHLKVILETGELADADLIRAAADTALEAGAEFLKTSTGKVPVNATPEAARILLEAIRDSGKPVGFKAAGGLRSLEDASGYLSLADEIMGADWARPENFRFGASSMLKALLDVLD